MRIGIDGSCLSNRRGFGRFARRLVEAMSRQATPHRFTVFVDGPSAGDGRGARGFRAGRGGGGRGAEPGGVGAGAAALARHDRHGTRRGPPRAGRHVLPGHVQLLPGLERGPAGRDDARHAAALASRAGLPPAGRADRLAAQGGGGGAVGRPDRDGLRRPRAARSRTGWAGPIRGSASSPRGPTRSSGRGAAGPESDAVLRRHGLRPGERYLLYVGGLSPHKNLPRLVEAFARSAGDDVRLVLTGDVHDVFHTCVPEIRAAIERHGLGDRVILTGFVPDEDLVFLYGRAYALVQPSLLEGFGLPAVEAMACGTPVISSRAGSLPEVDRRGRRLFRPDRRRLDRRRHRRAPGRPRPPRRLAACAPGAVGALHLGRRRARPARLLRRAGARRPRRRRAGDGAGA